MIERRTGRRKAWGDRFALALLFVAWFAQGGSAILHERLMPSRGIADVFCGLASSETLRSFRANAPSELLSAIAKRRDEAHRKASLCDLCVGVHAQLAAGLPAALAQFAFVPEVFAPVLVYDEQARVQIFAFEARGPPISV